MGEAGTTEGNPTIHAQPLFNGKVIFPVLEVLQIWKVDNIIEIWDKQSIALFEAHGCPLMNMNVFGCNKLKHLFPSKMHRLLKNLKMLDVRHCETMEGVVGFEGEVDEDGLRNEQVCFSKLTSIKLMNLPKLVSFCTKMGEAGTTEGNPTIHAQPAFFNGKVILPVLEELKVEGLNSIEEIWDKQSPSVNQETESFGQLRNIEVKGCKKLMNLVPSNILPRLRNLQFFKVEDCPNVEFVVFKNKKAEEEAADDSTLIIPQLRDLQIRKMEKLKRFYSSSTTSNAQSLFNHQVAFPALEDLSIWEVPMIRDIWPQQPLLKPEKEVESFCKLKSIQVWYCHQLEYVLPSYMLPQLHNLLQLKVNCNKLEVIVSNKLKEKEATNNDILVFPQLKTLELWNLNNLKCFYTGTDQLLFSHKVAFPALEDLDIIKAPHITEIWEKKPLPEPEQEIESFSKLATIDISGCDQLVYVLPSYMLPRLQNLRRLAIGYCKEVEVIVSKELMKEKEAVDNDPIVFSQLKDVFFFKLPKLKSFYTGTQLFFSDKVAFPALEELCMRKLPKIKEIWDKQPLPEQKKKPKFFYKPKSICVEDCDQLVYVFPSYMLPQLQNLEKLVIANCKEMEVIISNKLKEKEVTNNDIILFAELKTVILQKLPNLKRLCAEMQLAFSNKDAFPALEINTIEVAIKDLSGWWDTPDTSSIDPDLIFLVNGTSRKEVATEESGTRSKVEDNNDHNKEEEEEGEEDVKNAVNNEGGRGGGGEEKDDEGGGGGD